MAISEVVRQSLPAVDSPVADSPEVVLPEVVLPEVVLPDTASPQERTADSVVAGVKIGFRWLF